MIANGERAIPTRNVVITERQPKLIDELVDNGEYQNASEVLRKGIRLLEERRAAHAAKLEALLATVQVGIDELDRGEYREFKNTNALSAYLDKLTKDAIAMHKRKHR